MTISEKSVSRCAKPRKDFNLEEQGIIAIGMHTHPVELKLVRPCKLAELSLRKATSWPESFRWPTKSLERSRRTRRVR